jgi:hypothetical protein
LRRLDRLGTRLRPPRKTLECSPRETERNFLRSFAGRSRKLCPDFGAEHSPGLQPPSVVRNGPIEPFWPENSIFWPKSRRYKPLKYHKKIDVAGGPLIDYFGATCCKNRAQPRPEGGLVLKKSVTPPPKVCSYSPSLGDAQLLLDVGHHRVRQARLAEFREVLSDDALP